MTKAFDLGQVSIRRTALLAALAASRPKILALIAPAGFGKSTFARQVIADRSGAGIFDCTGVRGELDFARRLVPVLAEHEPGGDAALAQTELLLADGAMTPAQGAALGLAAWRASRAVSIMVFENAEHLAADTDACTMLARLLGDLPAERSIVICSREPLRIHLSRFAPPHRIVTLRASELALTRDEIEAIMGPLEASGEMTERIAQLSQGWPIAVFLLARFLQEGRLAELLTDLKSIAFEDLHDYLADQVLDALDPDIAEVLFAGTAVPNASVDDLVAATGSEAAVERFIEFEKTSPFVRQTETGTFAVHPLLATMTVEREPLRRRRVLQRTAAEFARRGDHLRSAELHLARGDQTAAAQVLERIPIGEDHAPSMRYARVLASLDRELVRNYPTLWACSSVLQMFSTNSQQLLDENTSIWRALPADIPAQQRYYIFITRVLLMTYLGQFDAALGLVESLVPAAAIPAIPDDTLRGYALYLHGLVTARLGRLDSAERDLLAAWPCVKSMDILGSAVLMILGADIERVRGNRDKERKLLERAIDATLPSGLSNITAQRIAEAAFGAWLAGEDELFAQMSSQLATLVDERGIRGFAYFANRARRGFSAEPDENDLSKWVACGHLLAYGDAEDAASAEACARAALDAARAHGTPHLIVLAAFALAEVAEGERTALHAQARAAAAAIDCPAFANAVECAVAGQRDVGVLNAYFDRRVRFRRKPPAPRLDVQILQGRVFANGVETALPDREMALLLLLASRNRSTSRETATETLWPELEEAAARNALNVCLHRLRQRLGGDALIVRAAAGYRLCEDARVDLWDIRHTVATLQGREHLSDREAQELRNVLERLHLRKTERFSECEWYRSIERRVGEWRSEIGQRLAAYSLATGRVGDALTLALQTIELDPCDEPAHELAIVAHLRNGDRAAALRQYRRYRDTLMAELQCTPSAHIAALVGAGSEHGRPA